MKKVLLICCIALALTGVAYADQVTPNIDKGTKELRLHGSLDLDHPLDYEYTLGTAFGLFVTDGLELGIGVNLRGNDLMDQYEVGGFMEYLFDMGSQWVPFISIGGYYAGLEIDDDYYNDPDDTDFDTAVGKLGAGVSYFLRDGVAIETRAIYSFAADDIYVDEDGEPEDTNLTFALGLRFYWD
jgi:opacity protein-like surface antigen